MIFQGIFVIVAATMGNLFKQVPRFIEELISFWTAFDGAWLLTIWPQGNQVTSDSPDQFLPNMLPLGLGSSPVEGWPKRPHRIDGALEA